MMLGLNSINSSNVKIILSINEIGEILIFIENGVYGGNELNYRKEFK